MKFQIGRFGMRADPRGAHVRLEIGGRTLLGEVRSSYYDERLRQTMLRVRHFNGEPWPFDPAALAVDVLERDHASDSEGERPDRPCDPTCARRVISSAECDCTRANARGDA